MGGNSVTELMKEKILNGIEDEYLSEAMDYVKGYKVRKERLFILLGRMAARVAIIIVIAFSSLSIAVAAGNVPAYNLLYSLYPDIAAKLMSVNASCEDGGIRMEVEGVSINGNFAYVYISMQDLEGKRIDESIDLFDSYSIHTNADEISGCTLVDFDKQNRKAMFLITVQNMDDTPIEGEVMIFSVSKFLSGKSEMRGELTQIYLNSLSSVTETQAEEDLNIRGRSYTDGEAAEEMTKKYLCVDSTKSFVPTPGVTVTNYGFINDKLHVQVHYEDITQFDNHGYIYLTRSNTKKVLPKCSIAFWDEEKKGSYEEYIFDINSNELKECQIYGHFFTCQNLVTGNWKVKFAIENRN